MQKVLFINACIRENSRTLQLAEHVLSKIKQEVEVVNLYTDKITPLSLETMEKREKGVKEGNCEDPIFTYAKQFAQADTIVIAAPYWDLSFPSVLKIYLEMISISGITFTYSEKGIPIGLCKAKNLYYVSTAGGFIQDNNFGFTYVEALSKKLFGIKDAHFFSAEGLDIFVDEVDAIMEKAKKEVDDFYE